MISNSRAGTRNRSGCKYEMISKEQIFSRNYMINRLEQFFAAIASSGIGRILGYSLHPDW